MFRRGVVDLEWVIFVSIRINQRAQKARHFAHMSKHHHVFVLHPRNKRLSRAGFSKGQGRTIRVLLFSNTAEAESLDIFWEEKKKTLMKKATVFLNKRKHAAHRQCASDRHMTSEVSFLSLAPLPCKWVDLRRPSGAAVRGSCHPALWSNAHWTGGSGRLKLRLPATSTMRRRV